MSDPRQCWAAVVEHAQHLSVLNEHTKSAPTNPTTTLLMTLRMFAWRSQSITHKLHVTLLIAP